MSEIGKEICNDISFTLKLDPIFKYLELIKVPGWHDEFKGAMSRGFCSFRSILS